jgi:hypothetical protein
MPAAVTQAPARHVALMLQRRRKKDTAPSSSRAGVRSRRSIRPANPSHARRCRVHRIPSRVRDDRDTPLMWDETAVDIKLIWVGGKSKYFCKGDWTAHVRKSPSGKSVGTNPAAANRVMQVIARRTLKEFWARHPHAEGPIRAWFATAAKAQWANPAEIKRQFGGTVDFVGQPCDLRSRRQQISFEFGRVLPSDTSWLLEPTTGVHQFGGGSGRPGPVKKHRSCKSVSYS